MPMRDERKPHDTSRNENADSNHAPAFEQAGRVTTGSDRLRTLLPRRRSAGVRARDRFDMIAQVIGRDNLFFGPFFRPFSGYLSVCPMRMATDPGLAVSFRRSPRAKPCWRDAA